MSDTFDLDLVQKAKQARKSMEAAEYRKMFRKIDFITPSPWQCRIYNCPASSVYGKNGNQGGKSYAVGLFATFNMLQEWPRDYTGWKQPKLNLTRPHSMVVWIIAPTVQMGRDGLQTCLLGDVAGGAEGTGLIPLENIVSIQMSRGIAGAVDSAVIRRADGTTAVIRFKSAEAGREAAQSEAVDIVIIDEMISDMSLFNELLARTTATSGVIRLCATPLRQQSPVAQWFREPGHPERVTIQGTLDDATHLSAEQRAAIKGRYSSEIELNTRYYGNDYQGGGAIYPTPMDQLAEDMNPSLWPSYYKYGIVIDFNHGGRSESASPFAAIFCAYDPMTKVLRIFDCFKMRQALPEQHVSRILQSPIYDLPVIWGHDGNQATVTGETYAQIYKRLGLHMCAQHAQFEGSGGYAVEPGIAMCDQWMATGKLKIAQHLTEFWTELSMYERGEDGKPIKRNDHLMDCMRLAVMSIGKFHAIDEDNRQPPQGLHRPWTARDWAMNGRRSKQQFARGTSARDDFDPWTGA